MKERYIELMEKVLSAYTNDHIEAYFDQVKEEGLTEHGFPRLTANIGILIAKGRRLDLLPLFREMMDFCCQTIPFVKAANDFSVREIITCITELEKCSLFKEEELLRWKNNLKQIAPFRAYNRFASTPSDQVFNWALFTGVSEYARQSVGLCDSREFIDIQLASQLQWLDENKMYKDAYVHPPMVYDLVSRSLFTILLHLGYRGKHFDAIDECLKETGIRTLSMLSVTGEIPYGGRSNQFLHNDSLLLITLEYEANRYQKEGNLILASAFKEACDRAVSSLNTWLQKEPIRHIKNRFPTESNYGCESYAYFDKYMITTASWLYCAYLICDDSITPAPARDRSPTVSKTSDDFHKIFMKCGDYALEFDTDADPRYDASGLGRVQRAGAPSAICLSSPCPVNANYTLDIPDRIELSLCPAALSNGAWVAATNAKNTPYKLLELSENKEDAKAILTCTFPDQQQLISCYTVQENCVQIKVTGAKRIGYMLAAFCFDGEEKSKISYDTHSLSVRYDGWLCQYKTNGSISDTENIACNRNGHYRAFRAENENELLITITIEKEGKSYEKLHEALQ